MTQTDAERVRDFVSAYNEALQKYENERFLPFIKASAAARELALNPEFADVDLNCELFDDGIV
jgi:hypothetical protein